MATAARFKALGIMHVPGITAFCVPRNPESLQVQPVPVLSTEEPDLSRVPTHQGRGLAVWGSVLELHRGRGGVETFYPPVQQ